MITNEVQYRLTKRHLRSFEETLADLRADSEPDEMKQLQIAAAASQADDLRVELRDYEKLASGDVSVLEASTLAGIATLLIQARVARGWTQARLAQALGVAEQQIQRYESSEYRSASLARICDVAKALRVDVTETARLRPLGAVSA